MASGAVTTRVNGHTLWRPPSPRLVLEDYDRAFEIESRSKYPVVEEFETRSGHQISRSWLEDAARVLACPIKPNPPCWQHGRVIYSAMREMLDRQRGRNGSPVVRALDIGTAKGFSALCARRALDDAKVPGFVTSVDVIDPEESRLRNTVAEVGGPKTLAQILEPWPEAHSVDFLCATGTNWLTFNRRRLHFVFVDGKHSYAVVRQEAQLAAGCQERGDVIVFDDVHVPGVDRAARELVGKYDLEFVEALPNRIYAVARRT